MRYLTLSLCFVAVFSIGGCSKIKKATDSSSAYSLEYGSKFGEIEKKAPKAEPFHIERQNVAVWLDPTTMKDDTDKALVSLSEHRNQIGTVRPVMYRLSEGEEPIVTNRNHYQKIQPVYDRLYDIAKSTNPPMRVEPTFGNVHGDREDSDNLRIMLKSPDRRKKALAFVERVAADPLNAGVDINWEGLPNEDFHLLTDFIVALAPRVQKLGKTLSVSLEPWYVYDRSKEWKRIGDAADRVTFIGYPAPKDFGPGPIAPTNWLISHMHYARKAIPGDKFALGIPLFGFEWQDFSRYQNTEKWYRYPRPWSRLMDVESIKFIKQRRRDNDGNPSFYKHLCTNCDEKIVCYEDATSIRNKLVLATQNNFGVKHFAFWRIGDEDPAVWKMIE